MSDPTPPAVSDAMREAVARVVDPVAWHDFDRYGPGNARTARDRRVSLLTADRLLKSGPIASEIARLTGERDAAYDNEAKVFAASMQLVARISAAEQDVRLYREQHAAAEAETARLRAALRLTENPLSYRHATDPNGPGSIAVARALEAVRAALSSQEQANV